MRLAGRRTFTVTVLTGLALILSTASLAATIVGTGKNDVLRGTSRSDVLLGRAGSDKLYGLGSSDALVGGSGNDMLVGGAGARTSCSADRVTTSQLAMR